jgi:hydrogenase maturation protease
MKNYSQLVAQEKTLILGVGNVLLSDEGIGVYVINLLKKNFSLKNIVLLDGGTLSFTLGTNIQEYSSLIVVDAANISEEPGSIVVFENETMDDFISSGKKSSVHEVGLADILKIALLNGSLPKQRALVAVQPFNISWGDKPTKKMIAKTDEIITKIIDVLK